MKVMFKYYGFLLYVNIVSQKLNFLFHVMFVDIFTDKI